MIPQRSQLPDGWTLAPLGRLMRFGNGQDYKDIEVAEGGYPVFGSGGEFRRARRYLHDGESVLFGRKGTIDRPLYVNGKFWTVDTMYYTAPEPGVVPKYVYYAATTIPFALYATNTAVPSMTSGALKAHRIALPPRNEQRAIANYLDQETAQIDALVAEQEKFIGLLRERREATWSKYLKLASAEGAMLPLRRVVSSIVDGPFGSSLTSAHYADEGTRVVRLGNIGINQFRNHDKAFIPNSYAAQLGGHDVIPGDVVIAGLGDEKWPLGRAAVVPEIGPAIVKADCFRARPTASASGQYIAWALSAPETRAQTALMARGSTRQRINTSIARSIEFPVPPPPTQEKLLNDCGQAFARVDALIAKAEEHIALAKERRSALITAAVTGQIDVRTARRGS